MKFLNNLENPFYFAMRIVLACYSHSTEWKSFLAGLEDIEPMNR